MRIGNVPLNGGSTLTTTTGCSAVPCDRVHILSRFLDQTDTTTYVEERADRRGSGGESECPTYSDVALHRPVARGSDRPVPRGGRSGSRALCDSVCGEQPRANTYTP